MEILLSISSKSDGSVREVTRAIDDGLAVGRGAEEGILLEGLDLSREHFVFTSEGSEVRIKDLSVNGTWLNGIRLRKSAESVVHPDDKIEIPGYVISFRLTDQPEETGEVEPELLAVPVAEIQPVAPAPPPKTGPLAVLAPVSRFIGSFTFMEKLLILAGLGGLVLLGTYIAA
jgi:FHA domain-containing protein